jgi:hypothetical protein
VPSVSDLLLHLRPCETWISFEGVSYALPAMDAVQWLVHLDGPNPDLYEIFPGLAGQQALEHVEDALWEGRVSHDDIANLSLEALAVAADRPWWVALRVIGAAKANWEMVHVNQAVGMSLAGWLDEIWSKIMERIDPKKKASWVSDIERPPKGTKTEVDFDAEEQAFLAAMNAVMK